MCPTHLILLDLIKLIISDGEQKFRNFSLCSFINATHYFYIFRFRYLPQYLIHQHSQPMFFPYGSVQVSVTCKSRANIKTQNHSYFRRCCKITKKRLLASSCLSVRVEKFGTHWTDIYQISYLRIFGNSV
jgi:hypothetical protein